MPAFGCDTHTYIVTFTYGLARPSGLNCTNSRVPCTPPKGPRKGAFGGGYYTPVAGLSLRRGLYWACGSCRADVQGARAGDPDGRGLSGWHRPRIQARGVRRGRRSTPLGVLHDGGRPASLCALRAGSRRRSRVAGRRTRGGGVQLGRRHRCHRDDYPRGSGRLAALRRARLRRRSRRRVWSCAHPCPLVSETGGPARAKR